ncbi:MAG TPA: hypothetical protein VMW47_10060 [Verrucomicrobiae bacterium]|nr:hypothetical protein [Verrucomicrobiae bacterium]
MDTGIAFADRAAFATRLATQLRARYPDWSFQPDPDAFAVRAHRTGPSSGAVSLALTTLYVDAHQPGASAPAEIARFVGAAAARLQRAPASAGGTGPDPGALLWCVRTSRSVVAFERARELLCHPLAPSLVAFVAEELPGEALRGVSVPEAEGVGLGADELRTRADHNTAARFAGWLSALERTQGTGPWQFGEDRLFASSLLMLPELRRILARRGGGHGRLAAPDRGLVLAALGPQAGADRFTRAVARAFREAESPLSPIVLVTDGVELAPGPRERRGPAVPSAGTRPWWRRRA